MKIRAWQKQGGWSNWYTVSVDKNGKFSRSFLGYSQLSVQLQVPKNGRTPATTSQIKVDFYGSVKVTSKATYKLFEKVKFNISVSPKWTGDVACSLTIARYDANGFELGRWWAFPTVRVKNGVGSYTVGAFEYTRTKVWFSCSANWAGLATSEVSGGSTTVY